MLHPSSIIHLYRLPLSINLKCHVKTYQKLQQLCMRMAFSWENGVQSFDQSMLNTNTSVKCLCFLNVWRSLLQKLFDHKSLTIEAEVTEL